MMQELKSQLAQLPTRDVGGRPHLAYQSVTATVAAVLFPHQDAAEMDAATYQHILETADTLCRELGYTQVVKLTPPEVPLSALGLYWTGAPVADTAVDPPLIHAGPGRVALMEDNLLLDARLNQLGLAEVSRQHFKIPVTASAAVVDLLHRAVAADWPNDYRGVWHDVLGMCISGGQDVGADERHFTVIIRGLGRRRYWRFKALLQRDGQGDPFLLIDLVDETPQPTAGRFELGHVVMTPGAAALAVDFAPYLARHAAGDWGELDAFDQQQNEQALRGGGRILSAYEVPGADEAVTRIWIITEADRRATTVLLPAEY